MGILTNFFKTKPMEAPPFMRASVPWERFDLPDLTDSKEQVELYEKLSWVSTAVKRVSEAASLTNFEVMKRTGDGREGIVNHPFEILLDSPNPSQSRSEFLEATFSYRLLNGNSYWWLNRARPDAPPDELWVVPPFQIRPIPDNRLFIRGYEYDPGIGQPIFLDLHEIVHFKAFHPTSKYVGLSPLEALNTVAQGDLAMQSWNTNYFARDNAKVPGFLAYSENINDTDWQVMKNEIVEQYGGTKRGLMMLRNVGAGGVQWVHTAMSQRDMEFLNARTFNKEEIFSIYAPGLASILAINATMANANAGKETFTEFGVWPLMRGVAEKVTNDLLPAYGEDLLGAFEDIRITDRDLRLKEIERYQETHTIDEVRTEFYDEESIGDERGALLVAEIGQSLGDAQLEYWRRRAEDVLQVVPQVVAGDSHEGQAALPPPADDNEPQESVALAKNHSNSEAPSDIDGTQVALRTELKALRKWARKQKVLDPTRFQTELLTPAQVLVELQVEGLLPIKQETIDEYEDELADLIDQAQNGLLTENDFSRTLKRLAEIAILFWFLRGAKKNQGQLTQQERRVLEGQIALAHEAAESFATDLFSGRYDPDPETGETSKALDSRIGLWGNSLLAAKTLGQLNLPGSTKLTWVLDPEKENCVTCLEYSGQTKSANDWQKIGLYPQSRELECGGWNCGCAFIEGV